MDVIRYRTEDGTFTALRVSTGRKYTQLIMMDSSGIRIKRVPNSDEKYMKVIDYPIEKAKAHFRDATKRFNNGHVNNNLREAIDYGKA